MELSVGTKLHGFAVQKITPLPDIEATAYEMIHEASGAKLFYLSSKDDNKVFTRILQSDPGDLSVDILLDASSFFDAQGPINTTLASG